MNECPIVARLSTRTTKPKLLSGAEEKLLQEYFYTLAFRGLSEEAGSFRRSALDQELLQPLAVSRALQIRLHG